MRDTQKIIMLAERIHELNAQLQQAVEDMACELDGNAPSPVEERPAIYEDDTDEAGFPVAIEATSDQTVHADTKPRGNPRAVNAFRDGEFYRTFQSISEASKATGIAASVICKIIDRGKKQGVWTFESHIEP